MKTDKRKLRQQKKIKKRIGILIILFIVLLGYFVVNNQFVKGLYYKVNEPVHADNPTVSLHSSNSSNILNFKNMVILSSANNVTAYNINGEIVETKLFSEISASVSNFTDLQFKSCDDYVIAYDKNGVNLVVFGKGKEILPVDVKSKIVFAKPFNSGDFMVIAEHSVAKNQVILYGNDGKEKYIWYSGVNNIIDAAYSSSERRLTVISSDLSTGNYNSKILFFDIHKNSPYSEMTFENVLFTNVNYYNKEHLVVLGDCGTYYFNNDGELINSYNFDNKMLSCYKQMPNGVMVLSFGSKSGNGTVVEIVGNKGQVMGHYETENDIISVDFDNSNILLCELRRAVLITKGGHTVREINLNKDMQKAFFLKNRFILIGNSEIRFVK